MNGRVPGLSYFFPFCLKVCCCYLRVILKEQY
jgi:hypothetical protein